MKKKFLSFALALCFAIPCMFFLASCGGTPTRYYYMTMEDIENDHVHFEMNSNSVKGGEDFTFEVVVGEGYEANKIVVSIDDEEVPLADGQWYIIDRSVYEYIPMTSQPKYPYSRKWIYTIENVQKNMNISVDASQVGLDDIEVSVDQSALQSKFYVLKSSELENTTEEIYATNLLGDEELFDELQVNNGKFKLKYGKDLFVKIPEDLVEAFNLKVDDTTINDQTLNETNWITYKKEEAGKKFVFASIPSYWFDKTQRIEAVEKEEEVAQDTNLVPIIIGNNPNFYIDFYKLSSAESTDAIQIGDDYFEKESTSNIETNESYSEGVYAYVGEGNIEDDPNYDEYDSRYQRATKKIALEFHRNDMTRDLVDNLEFSLTPNENQNNAYISSVKEVESGYDWSHYFVVIDLPEGYDLSKYLNFKIKIKESYLTQNYYPLDLTIQGEYGTRPIGVLSSFGVDMLNIDGEYYIKKDDVLTKHFVQSKARFETLIHQTAAGESLAIEDIADSLLQSLNVGFEDVTKYLDSYSNYDKCDLTIDGVNVDEIWTECGETNLDNCLSICSLQDNDEGIKLVSGYKYNNETDKPEVKFIWLSKSETEIDDPDGPDPQEITTYSNYYYNFATKTWHEKVGDEWKILVRDVGLETCEKPNEIENIAGPDENVQDVETDAILNQILLFDESADYSTYKYYSVLSGGLHTLLFARAGTPEELVFAIVDVGGTDYYYDYYESVWLKEKVLAEDEVAMSPELESLREAAFEKYTQYNKNYYLSKFLQTLSTENLTETALTDDLLKILRGAEPTAVAEDFKAYEISIEDAKFSNVTLIAEQCEDVSQSKRILVFDYNAYDGEEPEGTDIVHLVLDIREYNNSYIRELQTADNVFLGMNGSLSSGLYYEGGHLYRLRNSNADAYSFKGDPIFSATDDGNGFISVNSDNYIYSGTLIEQVEDGYIYMFENSQYQRLYFKTTNPIANYTYIFDNAYYYYDFETKKLSYPLYEFNSMVITQRQGEIEFNWNGNFDLTNAVVTINDVEKVQEEQLENPEFVSNYEGYEIGSEAQENFEFIENARMILHLYHNIRNEVEEVKYILKDNITFNIEVPGESDPVSESIEVLYCKDTTQNIYFTIFRSEYNQKNYYLYSQTDGTWYIINFNKGIPAYLELMNAYNVPDYYVDNDKLNSFTEFSELSAEELEASPLLEDESFSGYLRYLIAAQLQIDGIRINYYPESRILEYIHDYTDYSDPENPETREGRKCLVYWTENRDKVFVGGNLMTGYWYEIQYGEIDEKQIPLFLKKIEDKSRQLADFGLFDIEKDEITLSYEGIRDSKSLPHKLIFDELLELGDVYITSDATKTFDKYLLSDETLFTKYEMGSSHFENVNFADEVYQETKVVFYSEAQDIYVTNGEMEDVYDYDQYPPVVVGQRPTEVYAVHIAHVKDIFGENIAVEKDGKTFYLYVLIHQASTNDAKDWTLKEKPQQQEQLPIDPPMPLEMSI